MLKFTSSGLTEQAPANGYWVTFGGEGRCPQNRAWITVKSTLWLCHFIFYSAIVVFVELLLLYGKLLH